MNSPTSTPETVLNSIPQSSSSNVNCTELFLRHARHNPARPAIIVPGRERMSFGGLSLTAGRAQQILRNRGVGARDSVLVVDRLGGRLYATVLAILGLGAEVVLVEPWMPVSQIEEMIRLVQPKAFIAHWLGKVWGARVPAIRKIPVWISASRLTSGTSSASFCAERVAPSTRAILTFTSGTTGRPKGVVRQQGYLLRQHEVFSRRFDSGSHSKPDLCIFANFALANLASNRTSIVVPNWKASTLRSIDALSEELAPETLTAGPGFLRELMRHSEASSLRSIHVGGALTDCSILESAFEKWKNAHFTHVYGGSEVEPVALADAKEAVRRSRGRGLFQTLYLGKNVPEIAYRSDEAGLWVSGPHVCPEYLGNAEENRRFKRTDADGTLWHAMGDRIVEDGEGWWYAGRVGQPATDFELEQRIYRRLGSSKCFVHSAGQAPAKVLVGEKLSPRRQELLRDFPELQGVVESKIRRDRRHRARIDRNKSLPKNGALA